MSLSQNYAGVVSLIKRFRVMTRLPRGGYIDMRSIKFISPAAALVLVAELDRWRRLRNVKLHPTDINDLHPSVALALFEMGFFELLGTKEPERPTNVPASSPKIIRFCSGNKSDGAAAGRMSDALKGVTGGHLGVAENALYDAIVEAMTNAVQHAYPEDVERQDAFIRGEWWLTGSFTPIDGTLMVFVYDQGVGIPATLPKSRNFERISAWVAEHISPGLTSPDSRMIEGAVELGRSGTEQAGRGHGLAEIAATVYGNRGGRFRIISGCGDVTFRNGKTDKRRENVEALEGTLLQLTLKLPQSVQVN